MHCIPTTNIPEQLSELRKVTVKDGVHYVAVCHTSKAKRITSSAKKLLLEPAKPSRVTHHFWRGCRSGLMPTAAVVTATYGVQKTLWLSRLWIFFHG
jgi:hypothetical protein